MNNIRGHPPYRLLTIGNVKVAKGAKHGNYYPLALMLSPSKRSGYNVCPWASPGCIAACINTAGQGGFRERDGSLAARSQVIQDARRRRTAMFFENRSGFLSYLIRDLTMAQEFARRYEFAGLHENGKNALFLPSKTGMKVCIRLNTTSDISWEKIVVQSRTLTLFDVFPKIQFYDYTKSPDRLFSTDRPKNYHLTYSRHELPVSEIIARQALELGINVAVVFDTAKGAQLPQRYMGRRVIDGLQNDLRFLDPPGVIVGLRALGNGVKDTTGFVVRTARPAANPGQGIVYFDGDTLFPDIV